jgi:hypothetical protein
MTRLAYLLAAVVGLSAVAFLYGWKEESDAATGPATIRITSREVSRIRVDLGRPGRGPGDTEIVRLNLFNKRIKQSPIGQAEYVCTFTTARLRSCSASISLPRGRIVAGGSIQFTELYELAILGGTRLYDDARGTMTAIRTTRSPRRDILLFRLTG